MGSYDDCWLPMGRTLIECPFFFIFTPDYLCFLYHMFKLTSNQIVGRLLAKKSGRNPIAIQCSLFTLARWNFRVVKQRRVAVTWCSDGLENTLQHTMACAKNQLLIAMYGILTENLSEVWLLLYCI